MEPGIVLIEDSESYISELRDLLRQDLGVREEQVRVIRTEVEFYDRLPELEKEPPAIFIVDVMVPYRAVGDDDANVPQSVRAKAEEDRFYRAGIRCVNSLLENAPLKAVPIIVHSNLEKTDIESDAKVSNT